MVCAVLRDVAFSSASETASADMIPPVVANGGTAGGSNHEHQAHPGSTRRSADHASEIETALTTAKSLGAHVEALFITQPPQVTRGGVTVGPFGYGVRTATAAPKTCPPRHGKIARNTGAFRKACAAAESPLLSANDGPGPVAASWREAEGTYVEIAAHRAAAFDLVVAAGPRDEIVSRSPRRSLLQTRRPVLLAPSAGSISDGWCDDRLGREPGMLARGLGRHTVHEAFPLHAGHQR